MNNAKNVNMLLKIKAVALTLIMVMFISLVNISPIISLAENNSNDVSSVEETIYYCAEEVYHGEGGQVDASYEVYCDDYDRSIEYGHPGAPSFGATNLSNSCAPVAGANIIVFYDRWLTNLVPNYTPGMMNTLSDGSQVYGYFPDVGHSATEGLMSTLYQLMGTTAANGTTANQFRNGMQSYVSGKGHSISYESCYQTPTSVNLAKIQQAVANNKVALIMCSTYNFVDSVMVIEEQSKISVSKVNSNRGHMMMVNGYVVYKYFNNGVNFRTDTFLYVSSGYQTAERGYILLDEHLTIEEAYIVSIY